MVKMEMIVNKKKNRPQDLIGVNDKSFVMQMYLQWWTYNHN